MLDGENEDCKRKFLSKRLEMFSWLVNWGSHKEPGSSISQPCEFNWVSLICSSFNFVLAWTSPLYVYTQLAHAPEKAPKAKRRQPEYLTVIFYKSSISKKSTHRLIITEGPEEDGENDGEALRERR